MRREFILVLLGIICISTLSSLLSGYVQVADKILLDTVVGSVGAGNFSYWQSDPIGPLIIELTSLNGDADLYVSDTTRPSYEIDKYNFSSATCGLDLVHVPANFPRPIGIGVFGHWSHSTSDYSIKVFLDTPAIYSTRQYFNFYDEPGNHNADETAADSRSYKDVSHSGNDDESKPRFLMLLNVLDMMIEMFVL